MARSLPLSLRRAIARGFSRKTGRGIRARQYLLPPGTKAALTTAMAGTNNDLTITAVQPGVYGNSITFAITNGGASKPLVVSFNPQTRAISVQAATDGASAITSTAAAVAAAVNDASGRQSNHVQVANAGGNNGTGLVTILAPTALSGGTG